MSKIDVTKVFLIDDDEVTHFINRTQFKMFDPLIEVQAFESVPEALNRLEELSGTTEFPDLILCDINLPETDGYAFLQQYEAKEMHLLNHAKIVMLCSIHDSTDSRLIGESKVASALKQKPLNKALIEDILKL